MRITERTALVSVTGFLVAMALTAGFARDNIRGFYFPFSEALLGVVFVGAGALITRRHPTQGVGRIMLWMGVVAAAAQTAAAFDPTSIDDPVTLQGWPGVVAGLFRFLSIVLLFALIARFPDGRWTTPWARRLFWLLVGAVVLFLTLTTAGELGAPLTAEQVLLPFLLVPPGGIVLVVVVVVHLLRSDPLRRRQIGLVLWALGLSAILESLVEGLGLGLGAGDGVIRAVAILLIPTSIVVAVTRYRLYEIDRLLSRTVSYGLIIGTAVAVYFVVVTGMQALLPIDGDVAVALSTLVAWALSVPLARRFRAWVDRRFFRSRYDAAAVMARVAGELGATVNLTEVEARAEAVIDEVLAPESLSLWLAEEAV